MKTTGKEFIERVREATDFVALVEETVGPISQRPNGRAVMTLCPFHDDRATKSLAIYTDHAHCFGCGWHGDCFDWYQETHKVDFGPALDELARQAQIPKPHWTPEQEQAAQERREYEDALARAAQHFAEHLQETPALTYAQGRAWPDEVIRTEGLGYADGQTVPALGNKRAQQVSEALNRWAGKAGGALVYVHRAGGRVVYLAGRSITGKAHYNPPADLAGPKCPYVNALYSARAERVVIVEGQADAVTLAGWGFPALALAGSGLTGDLAARLERHVQRGATVYVIPDGDGKTAVDGLVEAVGPLLRVAQLPVDVNDVNAWAQSGATGENLQERLDAAPAWLALEIKRVAKTAGTARQTALRRLFGHLAALDTFMQIEYRKQTIETLDISAQQFRDYLKAAQGEAAADHHHQHAGRYVSEDGRLCVMRYAKNGGQYAEPLCNFTAEVVEDVARDNGEEVTRQFTVAGRLENGTQLPRARVDANKFTAMGWVNDAWGVQAVQRAGWRTKDQLREAIQLRSSEARTRHIYTHTGWREIDGKHVYLNAGGALGAEGVSVELDHELERYRLPDQPQDVKAAVEASLRFLEIAPLTITVPLWAAAYLAPLTEIVYPAFTIWLYGVTGTLKSTVAALALSHYGSFTDKNLFQWTDTANRLEKTCFLAKDAPIVIDDFAPTSDPYKAREMEGNAARIVRNVGNHGGRGRLTRDLALRVTYRPRGLVISTGEQVPDGQSVTARMYTVEVHPDDVNTARLTAAQGEAARYPHALAGYLLWLAGQWKDLARTLPQTRRDLRQRLLTEMQGQHLRIPDALATLYLGLDLGLAYAVEVEALSEAEAETWRERGWEALKTGAEAQASSVERERPSVRFFEVLADLLSQGKVRLEARQDGASIGGGLDSEMLGWYDSEFVYLLPKAAYNRVSRFLRDEGARFPVKERTLRKYLTDEGYLVREGVHYTSVMRIGKKTRRVLKLRRAKAENLVPPLLSP